KPIPAIRSRERAAVRRVPEVQPVPGSKCAPSERGKNSYHELNSARRRWTIRVYGPRTVTPSRSGRSARIPRRSAARAGATRAEAGSPGERRLSSAARTTGPSADGRVPSSISASTRRSTTAPSAQTRSGSMPAGIFTSAAWAQLSYGAENASIRKLQRPVRDGRISVSHRSSPGLTHRSAWRCTSPSGETSTSWPPIASCPSRKALALTVAAVPPVPRRGEAPGRRAAPRAAGGDRHQLDAHRGVPLPEGVRADGDRLALDAAGWEPPAVDHRLHVHDRDPADAGSQPRE